MCAGREPWLWPNRRAKLSFEGTYRTYETNGTNADQAKFHGNSGQEELQKSIAGGPSQRHARCEVVDKLLDGSRGHTGVQDLQRYLHLRRRALRRGQHHRHDGLRYGEPPCLPQPRLRIWRGVEGISIYALMGRRGPIGPIGRISPIYLRCRSSSTIR